MAEKKKKTDTPETPAPGAMGPAMMGGMPMQGQPMPGMMPQGQMPMQGQMQPGMQPGMMPQGQMPMQGQMQPGMMPQGQMQPGMMPQQGYMQPNPMMGMMQMIQMMMQGGVPGIDPAAVPFGGGQADEDNGLDADIIRPATLDDLLKTQEGVTMGNVLDSLCLTEDAKNALGGIPKGCTIAFAGPPGKGKTRSMLAALARVAATGEKVAYIVAEEGFHDEEGAGRDDLCSRLVKIGMAATGLDEKKFKKDALENVYVLESQYHKGHNWDDFVAKYRYLVEKEEIGFVVIDSLNMLDPSKNRTADNLSALKTYNHEQGVTCLCVGQVRDTGSPVGGEALMHTADAVFLLEELSLSSKDMAAKWGGVYREKIDVLRAIKSVTTPTFSHPVRVDRSADTGELVAHDAQPEDCTLLETK
ncbi:MAG: AAA family ATPase [Deltaproteobacteria bacterium]|nr:AAA family ATPase [Deltaproteobacteria bacterium]